MQNFRLNVYTVYLFWHRYSLHYNVLSGPIIISFSRSKGVNGKIICLCTRPEQKPVCMQNFKSSTATVIEVLLHEEDEEEDEESVKIIFTSISYLSWHFHPIFCMQLLFLHVLHLDVLRRQKIEIETESKNSLCMGIMLDHPWQSLYTQYYRTVW